MEEVNLINQTINSTIVGDRVIPNFVGENKYNMETKIKATWNGGFKAGRGQLEVENSAINQLEFNPVFAKKNGGFTNPEELLASAHATCYALTLSYILSESGVKADELEVSVALVLKNNFITNSNLELRAKIPGIENDLFQQFAEKTKEMCAVGNVLKAEVSVNAILEQ